MRCTRIEFKGYKPLGHTATNINGDITAFVGMNEVGKTSLLHALAWLTTGEALPITDRNRSRPPTDDNATVVTAYFALSAEDKRAIENVQLQSVPTSLTISRSAGGDRTCDLLPRPTRKPKPFTDAATRLHATRKRLTTQFSNAEDIDGDGPSNWADTVSEALAAPDAVWTEEQLSALKQLGSWLTSFRQQRGQTSHATSASETSSQKSMPL